MPEALVRYQVVGNQIVPSYLTEVDHPWLRELLDEHERFRDRPRRQLEEHLRWMSGPRSDAGKRGMALHALKRMCRDESRGAVPPQQARAALFEEATRARQERSALDGGLGRNSAAISRRCLGAASTVPPADRNSRWFTTVLPDNVVQAAARRCGVPEDALLSSLFADLEGERRVRLPSGLNPGELASRINLALAQSVVYRSSRVDIRLIGNAHAVVRLAKLRGLICDVHVASRDGVRLVVSGPFSLFKRTLVYGRALGQLVPLLQWSKTFSLEAFCCLEGRELEFRVQPGDPIFPSPEPRRFDSRLEERFFRDFAAATIDWEIIRNPAPVRAGDRLLFPDFQIRRPDGGGAIVEDPNDAGGVDRGPGCVSSTADSWFLEIVGFWTADYLTRKLAGYRAARLDKLILCIDATRDCSEGDIADARLVRFRRRIDPVDVLRIIEG